MNAPNHPSDTSKRRSRILPWAAVATLAFLTVLAIHVNPAARANARDAGASRAERVARGEYLVTIGGCNDCHTPWKLGDNGPEPDWSRTLSGHPRSIEMPAAPPGDGLWLWAGAATNTAFAGPWGVSFTANLTPHELTGTGAWSEEIFINTIRTGRHWGQSRPLLPPMPWFNYAKMTDDDLGAVFAYLRSIPPIDNEVPLPIPPGGHEPSTDDFF